MRTDPKFKAQELRPAPGTKIPNTSGFSVCCKNDRDGRNYILNSRIQT